MGPGFNCNINPAALGISFETLKALQDIHLPILIPIMSIASSLAKRRAQERIVKEREIFLKDEFKATSIAKWQEKSDNRIRKQDLEVRVRRLRDKNAEDLVTRRGKLKDLYEGEKEQWEQELKRSTEVPLEQKINAIRERANELQLKRQHENEAFVADCFHRQWSEGSDEVRSLKSKALMDKLMYDRKHTIRKKESDGQSNKENSGNNTQLMQALEKKDKEDAIEKQRRNLEIKLALDNQVEFHEQQHMQKVEQRQKEEAAQLKSWEDEEEEETNKVKDKKQIARERGKNIALANKQRFDDREADRIQKRREESILLDFALDKERKYIKAEMTNQEQNQGAANDYTKFLRDQMVKDAEGACEVERKRDAEMQAIWKKKDNDLKDKEDNRRRLAIEVKTSRDAQIYEKKRAEENRKITEAKEVQYNISVLERQLLDEKLAKEEVKKRTMENMLWNKNKMEEKFGERNRQKQEQYLIQKEDAEKEYQERVSKEADKNDWY